MSESKQTKHAVIPFVLYNVYTAAHACNCLSVRKDIFIGNAVFVLESTVEASVKNNNARAWIVFVFRKVAKVKVAHFFVIILGHVLMLLIKILRVEISMVVEYAQIKIFTLKFVHESELNIFLLSIVNIFYGFSRTVLEPREVLVVLYLLVHNGYATFVY